MSQDRSSASGAESEGRGQMALERALVVGALREDRRGPRSLEEVKGDEGAERPVLVDPSPGMKQRGHAVGHREGEAQRTVSDRTRAAARQGRRPRTRRGPGARAAATRPSSAGNGRRKPGGQAANQATRVRARRARTAASWARGRSTSLREPRLLEAADLLEEGIRGRGALQDRPLPARSGSRPLRSPRSPSRARSRPWPSGSAC